MTEADGAADKLFHDESSTSLKDQVEVKFVSPDGTQNGDAKINIGGLKSSFAGMGKEELMKYANDPFWIKLRWFLFICFWLAWFVMLLSAVAIVVYAPKCSKSMKYFNQSPLYEADVKSYKDVDAKPDSVGNFKGLSSEIDYFKNLGIKQLSLSSILKIHPNDKSVINFEDVNEIYGSLQEFKDLAKKLKAADVHPILSFSPVFSSVEHEFFKKSVAKEEPYTNYYIWSPEDKGKKGDSSWKFNEIRKEFYLQKSDKPHFNFKNQAVVDYFTSVLQFWLSELSGFHIQDVEYLLQDSKSENETSAILNTWGSLVHRSPNRVFIVGDSERLNVTSVDLVAHKLIINSAPSASDLKSSVDSYVQKTQNRLWQWSCPDDTLKCVTPPEWLKLFNILSFLLPGTPVIRTGEELGLTSPLGFSQSLKSKSVEEQDKDPFSHYSIYKKLAALRSSSPATYGSLNTSVHESVFAFTRLEPNKSGILVALNLAEEKVLNFTSLLSNIPPKLRVELTTKLTADKLKINDTVDSASVPLPGLAGIVFMLDSVPT